MKDQVNLILKNLYTNTWDAQYDAEKCNWTEYLFRSKAFPVLKPPQAFAQEQGERNKSCHNRQLYQRDHHIL